MDSLNPITLTVSLLLAGAQTAAVYAEAASVPGITYVEQPAGIELTEYVKAWPALEPYRARLQQSS
jgi:hypothetical protein